MMTIRGNSGTWIFTDEAKPLIKLNPGNSQLERFPSRSNEGCSICIGIATLLWKTEIENAQDKSWNSEKGYGEFSYVCIYIYMFIYTCILYANVVINHIFFF